MHFSNNQTDIVAKNFESPRKPVAGVAIYQTVATEEDIKQPKASTADSSSPLGRPSTSLFILNVWWREILACVLTAGAFVAIVVTLSIVHDRTLSQLPFHLSVNTLIAIFATILKFAAAFVLAEGLAQSKWFWYQKPRRPRDFAVYHSASRGPWGALQLLWYLRCRPLIASLGALITITAVLMDPFSQQLVRICDCDQTVRGEAAPLPRTQLLNEVGWHICAGLNAMSTGTMGSLATRQFSGSPPQPPFFCATGNYIFHKSIAREATAAPATTSLTSWFLKISRPVGAQHLTSLSN